MRTLAICRPVALGRLILAGLMVGHFGSPALGQDRLVVVTAEGTGALTIASGGESESIPLGKGPHNLALALDGRRAWVTDASASKVWVVEIARRKVVGLASEGKTPHGLALTPDGARAVITHEGDASSRSSTRRS